MMDDKDSAQDFLDEILGEPSEQIRPLLRAIESRLYEEEVDNLEVRFYLKLLTVNKTATKSPVQEKTEDISAEEMYILAGKYSNGETEAEQKMGFEWLLKAVDLGYKDAIQWAGQIYESGYFSDLEVGRDFDLAEKYYKDGYGDDPEAMKIFIGGLYESRGEENHKNGNYKQALFWYEKAIELNDCNLSRAEAAEIYAEIDQCFNANKAFSYSSRALDNGYVRAQYVLGYCYANGIGCTQDREKALSLIREAAEGGDSRAELWLKNNVNNIIEPEAIPEVIFSNMRILNTINKIDVRGKLNINNAMGKTFDVTVQWDFWDFDRLYTGKELLVDTITASYEFTEWMDFRFGVFNYDSIRPHSSPNKHEGECIIRVHEKESKDIIGQVSIPCNVEFKLPLFGDPKVQCTNYIFNEPDN
jgi:TPR repeat protein